MRDDTWHCPACFQWSEARGCNPGKCETWTPDALASQAGAAANPAEQESKPWTCNACGKPRELGVVTSEHAGCV